MDGGADDGGGVKASHSTIKRDLELFLKIFVFHKNNPQTTTSSAKLHSCSPFTLFCCCYCRMTASWMLAGVVQQVLHFFFFFWLICRTPVGSIHGLTPWSPNLYET